MTRSFWSDHDHVQIFARNHLVVMNRKTMSEGQGSALLDVWLDLFFIELRLELVRSQDHYYISRFNSGSNIGHFQAVSFCFLNGWRTGAQTNNHINAGVFQVARVGVTLRTVTDNGNFFALDDGKIRVFIVISVHG